MSTSTISDETVTAPDSAPAVVIGPDTVTAPAAAPAVVIGPDTVTCPHCRKVFDPTVDATQPPRFQAAKCPHCKLLVPARSLVRVLTREERERRG